VSFGAELGALPPSPDGWAVDRDVPALGRELPGVFAVLAFDLAAVVFAFGAFGFAAVPDFGAPLSPAFGVVAGLRALVPDALARWLCVVPAAGAPVFVPPARGVGGRVRITGEVDSLVSESRRKRPVAPETTLRPCSTTVLMRSLGVMGMPPL
jgi:hypothetical protein